MTRRITQLTDEQKAAIPAHVQRWIDVGWCTDPADWATFEEGARACYGYAGLAWPGRVVRVESPLVLSLAAPIAAHLLTQRRGGGAVGVAVDAAVDDAVDDAVNGAVRVAVRGAVDDAVDDAVRAAVNGAVRVPVHVAVGDAVEAAVDDAVDAAVVDAVRGAVVGEVDAAVAAAVHGAVAAAVHGAVDDAVRDAVDGAVRGAVDGAVDAAVRGAVRGAVNDAVEAAVDAAVAAAVHDAVNGAVDDAISRHWHNRLGGQWWVNWQAFTSYFRDICGLELDDNLWDRDRAYAQTTTAGWWWPHHQFVMVSNRPTELHLEQVRPTGWGSHRLHRADGPAIRWRDGWALHYWHGTRVPADLIETGWTTDRILREPNTEIRRCAVERLGWDRFVTDAHLTQVGQTVPDPGNPGADLALYDVPEAIYNEPVRVLLARNGTPEHDGTFRRFGLTVPADIGDPIAAAAWTYSLHPDEYAQLARRA
jgi:hypothetical protein